MYLLYRFFAAVFPVEGSTRITVDVGATNAVVAASKCTCRTGGTCSDPTEHVSVINALSTYNPDFRDMKLVEVEVKVGEIMLFADKLMHAGGAAVNPINRRIFFAIPFGDVSHVLENEVVVVPNSASPSTDWFDGSKKC